MKPIMFAATLAALAVAPSVHAQALQVVTEESQYVLVRDGKATGPATRIVESSLQAAGLADYRIGVYPWARAYDMALHDPNVLIYLIGRTPARENLFKWIGEFATIHYHFYKLRDRHDIVVNTLADAKNYTVGVTLNDVRHQYLQGQGFTKLVVSSKNIDNFRKLLDRQVQLLPVAEGQAALMCTQARFDCSGLEKVLSLDELAIGLYMAFSKSTPDAVVERLRASFQKLKADGTVSRWMDGKP